MRQALLLGLCWLLLGCGTKGALYHPAEVVEKIAPPQTERQDKKTREDE